QEAEARKRAESERRKIRQRYASGIVAIIGFSFCAFCGTLFRIVGLEKTSIIDIFWSAILPFMIAPGIIGALFGALFYGLFFPGATFVDRAGLFEEDSNQVNMIRSAMSRNEKKEFEKAYLKWKENQKEG
ncbi:MAG TPA: hypothetical protein VI451_13565, partial [Anaerolineales bacterium]|nr:hypothetical protein [Anaerolineales bacterium]